MHEGLNGYVVPTPTPTAEPTPVPTAEPTPVPTAEPTPVPTAEPTPVPTAEPTPVPTAEPTPVPTAEPTPVPTAEPTPVPGGVTVWVPGQTTVKNGDLVTFGGLCFEAKNNPGSWETPAAGGNWFWTEVQCEGGVTPTVAPTAEPTVAPTVAPTVEPTVEPTTEPGNTTWKADAIYNKGDTVIVDGVTYTAKWWTTGENPTTTGPWGVWAK
ncbi:hypothetical protein K6Y31_07545 [Motilimonas cestriensis]|uniref:Chitin-binding type-3 domain-containing protein n=2 Tax=Motilimonas cestriensis TaxID=2742685 RepID=A0ABS8W6N6_9GAMM|nr:hypothetical protein [Motilimonas cestriensis]